MSEKLSRIFRPISFENAGWAYLIGAAAAIKKGQKNAADIAETLGEGLQAFCIPGSVADDRKVGIGHGNLASMLLREETTCFAFCAGHESFAAAEGAIGLAKSANKASKIPLRVILNGLGKGRGSHYRPCQRIYPRATAFDYKTGISFRAKEKAYSKGERAAVRCYGADDVREGVAIMHLEGLMSPSREIPPIRRVSSIRLWVFTKKNACWRGRSFSPSLPAVEQEERFIPITWPRDRHPMA